jgi:hypothetical protein
MKNRIRPFFLAAFAAAVLSAPAVRAAEGDLLRRYEMALDGYTVTDTGILAGLPDGVTAIAIPQGVSVPITIPEELLDRPGHPYTLVMKIKTRIENGWVSLLNMPASNDSDMMVYLEKDTRRVCIKQFDKTKRDGTSDRAVELDRWTTVAIAFGEDSTDIYLDGDPILSTSGGSLAGSYADCYSAGGEFLIGADDDGEDCLFYIADLRIYDGAVAVGDELPGFGTTAEPFLISSAADWELFAYNINHGHVSGKKFPVYRLEKDIGTVSAPVTQSVGEEGLPFRGVFDGNGHTIRVAISGDAPGTAPFGRTDEAIIGNLTVAGSVSSTADHAAGLVGICDGTIVVTNCTVSASVTVSGAGHAGGILGRAGDGIAVAFENDVFSGSVSGPSAHAGGLIGWCESLESLTLIRCLFKGSFSGSGKWQPIACMEAGSTISFLGNGSTLHYLNTAMPTEDADHVIPGAEGVAVSENRVPGWTMAVTAADGNVYYRQAIALAASTGALTVHDGDVLTGTGGTETVLVVEDGATVTLRDVDITALSNDASHKWPAIWCDGDATLVLEGTNILKGGHSYLPAIYVPTNKTLVIRGDGALDASSNGQAPGIGALNGIDGACGNIVIEGGTITATGGRYAAGIGCAIQNGCGGITISGGTVFATGGQYAAGIGGSYQANCGTISISGGTVTAQGGQYAPGIGSGVGGECAGIAISGGTVISTGGDTAPGIGGGSGSGKCDAISITGGTVEATGTAGSAGIGCGVDGSECGAITIEEGVIRVTATHGDGGDNSVGAGQGSTCGTITIAGEATGPITENPWVYAPGVLEISTVADWNAFASRVNRGVDSYAGATVTLAADVGPVATPVGTDEHPFRGTFDGGGHTLSVALADATASGLAPFQVVDGATIRDLAVTGTVSGGIHSAGLVGRCPGTSPNAVLRCSVAADVAAPSYAGGIVGHGGHGTLSLEGCVFSGSVSGFTNYAGGLFGWCDALTLAIDDCLVTGAFAPGAGGKHHPVGCKHDGSAVAADVSRIYWLHTLAPTATGDHLIPAAGGIPVSDTLVPFQWARPVTAADGLVYYAAGAAQESVIASTADWDAFAASVRNGEYYEGKTVRLGADIAVTTIAGELGKPFAGTFDGDGHVLTVRYETDIVSGTNDAPFACVFGATIQNLVVDGTITVYNHGAAGIVGDTFDAIYASNVIRNCRVSATISGIHDLAGFSVGGFLTIENCLFDGKITGLDRCAGFVARSTAQTTIANCLSSPQEGSSVEVGTGGTFYCDVGDGAAELINCRYTATLGTTQGDDVSGMYVEELQAALGVYGWEILPDGQLLPWMPHPDPVVPGYGRWASENGLAGDWDAVDADGVANVFRYLFGKPAGTDGVGILALRWGDDGRPVVVTPPLVNTTGFNCVLESAGTLDWTGIRAAPLSPEGETTITNDASIQFFRLTATPSE